MDIVKHNMDGAFGRPSEPPEDLNTPGEGRIKTSLRLTYEAQAQVIRNQIGDLEDVRLRLGLSARKLCQLLLVDPSAWTRWKAEGKAPPHVWRALQWYFIIQEKIPGLTAQYFIGKDFAVREEQLLVKIREIQSEHSQNSTQNAALATPGGVASAMVQLKLRRGTGPQLG